MFKLLTRNSAFGAKNVQNILKDFGIINPNIARNLRYYLPWYSASELYVQGMQYTPADPFTKHNDIASSGAFVAYSGLKTG